MEEEKTEVVKPKVVSIEEEEGQNVEEEKTEVVKPKVAIVEENDVVEDKSIKNKLDPTVNVFGTLKRKTSSEG